MALVTVFRHIPPPIIGTVGVTHDRGFEAFEERLDWLEASGFPVERFDPATEPSQVAAHESARRLLSKEGDRCLPLVLVDEAVVLRDGYPSRAELARAVGRRRCSVPPEIARTFAALGAAAAIGSEDEVRRQVGLARRMGLCEGNVELAEETGTAARHDAGGEPADTQDRV